VQGYLTNFLVEPFVPHPQETEYYININSVREGDNILFYHEGGVDVGDVDAKASRLLIAPSEPFPSFAAIRSQLLSNVPAKSQNVLIDFIVRLYSVYVDLQFTYLEINPLVVIPTAVCSN
jgi:ATP citrate (pro-S)-lyase